MRKVPTDGMLPSDEGADENVDAGNRQIELRGAVPASAATKGKQLLSWQLSRKEFLL